MKKILALLFILPLLVLADRVDDLIKNVPGLEQFPDASAINVFTEVKVKVNPDFSSEKQIFYIKKILSYEGKKRYSDVILNYNGDYEKLELGKCFTIDKNQQRVEIPANQVTDLNDQMSIIYPEFINSRQRIINFPQIEPGAFVVLEYTLKSSRKEPVSGVEHFQESNPYLVKSLEIEAPANLQMQYRYPQNKGLVFKSSEKKGSKIYSWSVKNSPLIKEENNSPSYLVSGTPVVYSFYQNWQNFADLKLGKINVYPQNSTIKDLAAKITANAENKLLAIYQYMAKEFSLKASYTSQISFTPQPLEQLLSKKYGSSREMAALFIALSTAVGVKDVYPAVLLNNRERFYAYQTEIAVDDFLSEIVVFNNGQIYQPGNSHIPFAYGGANEATVIVGRAKDQVVNYQYPHDFLAQSYRVYDFAGSAAQVKISTLHNGGSNQEFRDRYQDEPVERRKIWFTNQAGDNLSTIVSGPDFENLDQISAPLELKYQKSYADFITTQQNYSYFPLPSLPVTYITGSIRSNAYQVENEINAKDELIFNLTENSTLLSDKEIKREFSANGKKAFYKSSARLQDKQLIVKREVFVPEMIISVQDYPAYHKFMQSLSNPADNMIFLQK